MMKPVIGITCGIEIMERSSEREVLLDAYTNAIERAGGVPLILPNPQDPALIRAMADRCDGIMISGGPDADPRLYGARADKTVGGIRSRRDKAELELIRYIVQESDKPLLGICRGLQMLNVALGGDLYVDLKTAGFPEHSFHDIYPRDMVSHEVRIEKSCRLQDILGEEVIGVNSFHHQAVKTPAPGLLVTAWAEPDELIEALELPGDRFILGVQWHPEGMTGDEREHNLFRCFIEAAAAGSADHLPV